MMSFLLELKFRRAAVAVVVVGDYDTVMRSCMDSLLVHGANRPDPSAPEIAHTISHSSIHHLLRCRQHIIYFIYTRV